MYRLPDNPSVHPGVPPCRRAFTLIELLVVIAIIAVLIGILVPAVQKVREAAARLECANQVKQMALACHNFENVRHRFPMLYDPPTNQSWMIVIMPFIEQQNMLNNINSDLAVPVALYLCPSEVRGPEVWQNSYACHDYPAITGTDYNPPNRQSAGIINPNWPTRFANITDGTSNTLLIGERPFSTDWYYGWWAGYTLQDLGSGGANQNPVYTVDQNDAPCPTGPYYFGQGPKNVSDPCSFNQLWSQHFVGANFAFGDGSVRFLSYNVSTLVPGLATMAGGEIVNSSDLD